MTKLFTVFTFLVLSFGAAFADGHLPSESDPVEHIVLFKFADHVSDAQIKEVQKRFEALEGSKREGETYISELHSGFQNSKEGLAHGYELGFIVSFENEKDRDYYVGRPFVTEEGSYDKAHDAFKAFVGPLLAKENGVLVFDFPIHHAGH